MVDEIIVVWFKRDLRFRDHEPLFRAAAAGVPVLPIYILEPEHFEQPDFSWRHVQFVYKSARVLERYLPNQQIFHAPPEFVFEALLKHYRIRAVYSHMEIGAQWTFNRDLRMRQFFQNNGVVWQEFKQFPVFRGLTHRTDWDQRWKTFMRKPLFSVDPQQMRWAQPIQWEGGLVSNELREKLNLPAHFQRPGCVMAEKTLHGFLDGGRFFNYQKNISKPALSRDSCSRLSVHIAYGTISLREIFQRTMAHYETLTKGKQALQAFINRIHWHSHFVQKFESETRMQFENLNRGFDGMDKPIRLDFIEAWRQGRTGVPMVDACMRCVMATGYLNFRMRAMLVSFLTFNLWQPWQTGVLHLAQAFLDYEPGIHYPQFQMQSGTTGINTVRLYNPVKQGQEHDPEGTFIKKWIPELTNVPKEFIHEPWKMPPLEQIWNNFELGRDYPLPIVDVAASAAIAREKIWAAQKWPEVQKEAYRILRRHVTLVRKPEERTKIVMD